MFSDSPPAIAKPVYKRPESVLVVVYRHDRKLLLLLRCQPAGYWQSVTGSLRRDETPLQAAQRELAEEIGVTESAALHDWHSTVRFPILPAWRPRYDPAVTHNTEYLYSLELPAAAEPVLHPGEHNAWLWLPAADAVQRVSSRSNRDAIRRLAAAGLV